MNQKPWSWNVRVNGVVYPLHFDPAGVRDDGKQVWRVHLPAIFETVTDYTLTHGGLPSGGVAEIIYAHGATLPDPLASAS